MVQLNNDILHKVITKRPENSHKGTFGRVVLIGGNHQYGGAIIMSAEAMYQKWRRTHYCRHC